MVWSFSFRVFGEASPGRVLAVLFCGGGPGCFFLVLEQLPELAGSGREKLNSKVVWPTCPLVRGNPLYGVHGDANARSIPAWAGEPLANLYLARLPGVYPRVGGGTRAAPGRVLLFEGLSPRGRGNRQDVG